MSVLIISIAVLAVPAVYTTNLLIRERKRKQKERALALAYEQLVIQNRLSALQAEILNRKVIALDRKNKKVVLVDHSSGPGKELCISLRDIISSRVVEIRDKQDECLQKILLVLKHKCTDKETVFCFYEEGVNSLPELKMMYRKALQWKNRIDIHRHKGNVNLEMEYVL
jgi:hypothetical protein